MEVEEFEKLVRCAKYTSGFNQRYHQICEWRWGVADKAIRVAVGVFAVFGFWLGMKGAEYAVHAEVIAVLSLAVAFALNVIPTGEREKYHAEQFHRWSDLRKTAESLGSRLVIAPKEGVTPAMRERIEEIIETEHSLHSGEPAPWVKLLLKCQEEENQSEWGPGIRTHEQVEEERDRRLGPCATA